MSSESTNSLKGKHILVGVSGGIAAYKIASLVRMLVKSGAEVKVVMTPSAKEFITPLTLATLSGNEVISEFFTANTGHWNSHVSLGLWADVMVIAPATACTIGKMVSGVADNMLVTTYLSMKAPVFVAPAMDLDMYAHPTTTRNLGILRQYGTRIIEPGCGFLASGLTGKGRMAEPEEVFNAIASFFICDSSLKDKKILITSGPTHEKIDPVRYIGNYSSGKMGTALARECVRRGAEVVMISGPAAVMPEETGIHLIKVTSAKEMQTAALQHFPECDAAILAAAVADYAPLQIEEKKIKRENRGTLQLTLIPNPDIAASLGKIRREGQTLIGFALETDDGEHNACDKMRRKGLDWIVLNTLGENNTCFGADTNRVDIFDARGQKHSYAPKSKQEVAADIIDLTLCKNS